MKHTPSIFEQGALAPVSHRMPAPLDSETRALLRGFIAPVLETSKDWSELSNRLRKKGYDVGFRQGHLVVINDTGTPLCTGSMLGVPLREIAARIGRPSVRATPDGLAGALQP